VFALILFAFIGLAVLGLLASGWCHHIYEHDESGYYLVCVKCGETYDLYGSFR
jgi:hypothetical protein